MKKCYFRSFDVGIGDCNVIRIIDGDKQYSIMVDCGRFTTPVKDYVINVLNKHIDILIATHIDGDHISGFGKMLTEISDIKIDHIWYNAYRRTAAEVSAPACADEKISMYASKAETAGISFNIFKTVFLSTYYLLLISIRRSHLLYA